MPRKLRITIGEHGTIRAETIGIKGPSCMELLDLMGQLADAEVVDSAFTAEYYDETTVNEETVGKVNIKEGQS
jgi:hypothetical protein